MSSLSNMPNIDDLLKSPKKISSSKSNDFDWNFVEKTLRNKSPAASPTFSLMNELRPKTRKIAPRAVRKSKIAPRTVAPSKIAPKPPRLSSPDREFGHKYDGVNTGERDRRGRIIYVGSRGGKYVISSSGSRVPLVHDRVHNKAQKGQYESAGKVDRKGQKVFKGKRGGLFVIDEKTKRRKNPIYPLRNA